MSEEEIHTKIKEKITVLSGLVSEAGAAHIIANEYGIKLVQGYESSHLELKNLVPGLRNVTVFGRIVRTFPPRSFTKDGKESKVGNVIISDGTTQVRIVIWDQRVEMIEKNQLKPNEIIKVDNAYVKENTYNNMMEVHLREKSLLKLNPEDAPEIPEVDLQQPVQDLSYTPKKIFELQPNSFVNVFGTIIQVFVREPFFEVCPKCKARVKQDDAGFVCPTHGIVEPIYSMVLNVTIDDGTGTIRTVFWGQDAEKILGTSIDEAHKLGKEKNDLSYVIQTKEPELIGKQISVDAKATVNSFSNALELSVRSVKIDADPKKFVEKQEQNVEFSTIVKE